MSAVYHWQIFYRSLRGSYLSPGRSTLLKPFLFWVLYKDTIAGQYKAFYSRCWTALDSDVRLLVLLGTLSWPKVVAWAQKGILLLAWSITLLNISTVRKAYRQHIYVYTDAFIFLSGPVLISMKSYVSAEDEIGRVCKTGMGTMPIIQQGTSFNLHVNLDLSYCLSPHLDTPPPPPTYYPSMHCAVTLQLQLYSSICLRHVENQLFSIKVVGANRQEIAAAHRRPSMTWSFTRLLSS